MHLLDLLAARAEPAAAVLLTVTRRCPLACAHCSTASSMASEQIEAAVLKRFVGTFTPADRPEYVLLTGGEPLLRPRLVAEIAERVRDVGGRTQLLSGMFFAAHGRTPAPVRRAIDAVDHFAASIDAFHEREVPRTAVLRVLRRLLDEGKDVSVQLTGLTPDDPYLRHAAEDIRRELDDRVPVLVTVVRSAGRARTWLPEPGVGIAPAPGTGSAPAPGAAPGLALGADTFPHVAGGEPAPGPGAGVASAPAHGAGADARGGAGPVSVAGPEVLSAPGGASAAPVSALAAAPEPGAVAHRTVPAPCSLAAWPVVCFDGTVAACCNQDVVDAAALGRLPAHLRLGHIAHDDWATIRERLLERELLRGIRAFGPRHLASLAGADCDGYCAACVTALGEPGTGARAGALLERPGVRAVERRIDRLIRDGGAEAFLRRYGTEGYRELAALGHEAGAP
ncbi:radical SAM protein [Streptomyces sp. BRA346]|uniref:radical SAM protein n=1 Tax=Streptomyces sp. BRA346 TaxID=2878199 RepID=UPI00406453B9